MANTLINPQAGPTDPSNEFVPERQVLPRSFDAALRAIRVLPSDDRTFALLEAIYIELARIRVGMQLQLAAAGEDIDLEREVTPP